MGTIFEYYLKFMSLANRSMGLLDVAFLNCFINSLHTDIHRDVIVQFPTSILRAISLAKFYEEKYASINNSISSNYSHRYSPILSNHKVIVHVKLNTTTTSSHNATVNVKQNPITTTMPPFLPTFSFSYQKFKY